MGLFSKESYKKLGPDKSRIPSILFISSVILAFIFLLINYVENVGSQRVKSSDLVPIYFVTSPVSKYARITDDIIEEFLIPRQYVPPSLSIGRAQLLESYASRPMAADEVISKHSISMTSTLSQENSSIANEYRLVFIPVDGGIISYVEPGDNVDVFFTFSADGIGASTTERIFSSVEVFTTSDNRGLSSMTDGENQILGDVMGSEMVSDLGQQGLILIIPRMGIEKLFFAMANGRIDVALVPEI
ncbi:MAG: RcpC/CpaB family pilus assembly protein [Actinobacteria bacterium]|nr:RcpC/CpaB family pilus assembly protein [Actinomycetota bacterium]